MFYAFHLKQRHISVK